MDGWEPRLEAARNVLDICFGVGLSVRSTARVIRESEERVWHEWSVRTGLPTPRDPASSVIRRRVLEVQRGWTEDIRQLARCGCTQRQSSATVEYRQAERRAKQKQYDQTKKANQCHSDSIDAKAKASPFPVMTQQMTLSFLSTACEATA
jgi:hypothetical protein